MGTNVSYSPRDTFRKLSGPAREPKLSPKMAAAVARCQKIVASGRLNYGNDEPARDSSL